MVRAEDGVSAFSSRHVPPPNDWQAFERLCADLWRCLWNDPDAQQNGRSGQAQHGVDVFGRNRREGGSWEGVQCKGKNKLYGEAATTRELTREAAKAKKFTPPLSRFVFATTAPNDAKLQEHARILSEQHRAAGLFEVVVYGWEEIVRRLSDHPALARKFYPDLVGGPGRNAVLDGRPFAAPGTLRDIRERLDRLGAVVLLGEPGVGKTTVADRIAKEEADRLPGFDFLHASEAEHPSSILRRPIAGEGFLLRADDPWGKYELGRYSQQWTEELGRLLETVRGRPRGAVRLVVTSRRDLFESCVAGTARAAFRPFAFELRKEDYSNADRAEVVRRHLEECGGAPWQRELFEQHWREVAAELDLPWSLQIFARRLAEKDDPRAVGLYELVEESKAENLEQQFNDVSGGWTRPEVLGAVLLWTTLAMGDGATEQDLRDLADDLRAASPRSELRPVEVVRKMRKAGWLDDGPVLGCHPSVLQLLAGVAERHPDERDQLLADLVGHWLGAGPEHCLERLVDTMMYRRTRVPSSKRAAMDGWLLNRVRTAGADAFTTRFRQLAFWHYRAHGTPRSWQESRWDIGGSDDPVLRMAAALDSAEHPEGAGEAKWIPPPWTPAECSTIASSDGARRVAELYVEEYLVQPGLVRRRDGELAGWFRRLGWDLTPSFRRHLERHAGGYESDTVGGVVHGALPPGSDGAAFDAVHAVLREAAERYRHWSDGHEAALNEARNQGFYERALIRMEDEWSERRYPLEAAFAAFAARLEESMGEELGARLSDEWFVRGWAGAVENRAFRPSPQRMLQVWTNVPVAFRHRLLSAAGRVGGGRLRTALVEYLAAEAAHVPQVLDAVRTVVGARYLGAIATGLVSAPSSQRVIVALAVDDFLPAGTRRLGGGLRWLVSMLPATSERAVLRALRWRRRREGELAASSPLLPALAQTPGAAALLREIADRAEGALAVLAVDLLEDDPTAADRIDRLLVGPVPAVRQEAMRVAARRGPAFAVPRLLDRLGEVDPCCRAEAVRNLSPMGSAPGVKAALMGGAQDPNFEVRSAAAAAISANGWEDGVPALLSLLDDLHDTRDEPGDPPYYPVAHAALKALSAFAARDAGVHRRLLGMLNDAHPATLDGSVAESLVDYLLSVGGREAAVALSGAVRAGRRDHLGHAVVRLAVLERWNRIRTAGRVVEGTEPQLLAELADGPEERVAAEAILLLAAVDPERSLALYAKWAPRATAWARAALLLCSLDAVGCNQLRKTTVTHAAEGWLPALARWRVQVDRPSPWVTALQAEPQLGTIPPLDPYDPIQAALHESLKLCLVDVPLERST